MLTRFPFELAHRFGDHRTVSGVLLKGSRSKQDAPLGRRIFWQQALVFSLIVSGGWMETHRPATAQEPSPSTPPVQQASPAPAEKASTPPTEDAAVSIELNKLEPQGQGCRAYFVVGNKATEYQELKLDLVLFRPDGVIGRRFAVDLAPLKADKRSVKLFDIEGTKCEEVGSFLINDVMECKAQSGPLSDCLKNISVSTRTKVELNK